MKMMFPFIMMLMGYLLSIFFGDQRDENENPPKATSCAQSTKSAKDSTSFIKSDHSKVSCVPIVANQGMGHKRSEVASRKLIFRFFNESLKSFYEDPNEYNVVTNDSDFGTSLQKYDPREDIYIRFEKKDDFEKKVEYGVVKGFVDVQKFMMKSECNPTFNGIEAGESIKFGEYLKGKSLIEKKRPYKFSHEDMTFLRFIGYIPFLDSEFFNRYKSFRNDCNKAISKPMNFCLVNPSYDLQYEDMFVFPDEGKAASNVYCRKSNEKKWTLVKKHFFGIR